MAVDREGVLSAHEVRKAERAESMGLVVTKASRARRSHATIVENKVKFSKQEEALLRSMALTVEDNPWQRIQFTNKFNSLAPSYDPTALSVISYQNNTLRQCIAAMIANVDETGYDIVRKDGAKIQKVPAPKQPAPAGKQQAKTPGNPVGQAGGQTAGNGTGEQQEPLQKAEVRKDGPGDLGSPNETVSDGDAGQKGTTSNAREQPGAKPSDTGDPNQPDTEAGDTNGSDAEGLVDPPDVARIKAFFDEPYPGVSFMTMRKMMRDHLETTGNAYLEVIRDASGKLALLNPMDAKLTRLIRHDDLPVAVTHEVNRTGKPGDGQKVTLLTHERRFVQIIGLNARFFKVYKATRNLNAQTGIWQNDSIQPLMLQDNATEVLHFIKDRDVLTPYGIPSWVNQIPSVMGSRKAEELNLEYFESGGVPPMMILIQGGTLSANARMVLTDYLSGQAKFKQRGVVVEIAPSGGDLNSAAQVKTDVQQFAGANSQDSKFETYDDKCTQRVRSAFRLPPLLIGLAQDYNYATAQTAYMIAEEQVFAPERKAFDEIINATVMKELDPTGTYVFKSNPMTAKFMDEQIKALMLGKGMVDTASFIEALNEVAGLDLKIDPIQEAAKNAGAQAQIAGMQQPMSGFGSEGGGGNNDGTGFSNTATTGGSSGGGESGFGGGSSNGAGSSAQFGKSEFGIPPGSTAIDKNDPADPSKMIVTATKTGKIRKLDARLLTDLAADWAGMLTGDRTFTADQVVTMDTLVKSMTPSLRNLFAEHVSMTVIRAKHDPPGVQEILGCAADILARVHKAGGGDSLMATPKVNRDSGVSPESVQLIAKTERRLYVERKVLNGQEIVDWFKAQGIPTCLPPDKMHITVCYSKKEFDPVGLHPDSEPIAVTGGQRELKIFGPPDDQVLVMTLQSTELQHDHMLYRERGASWDWPSYEPHVTITTQVPPGLDKRKLTPYPGTVNLSAEEWSDVRSGAYKQVIEKCQLAAVRRHDAGEEVNQPVEKDGNPYHDSLGRFTSASGAGGAGSSAEEGAQGGTQADSAQGSSGSVAEQIDALRKAGVFFRVDADTWSKISPNVGPQDFIHGLTGTTGVPGLAVEYHAEEASHYDELRVKLTGKADVKMFGATVGGYERVFDLHNGTVNHELLTLAPGSQDGGAIKAMFRSAVPMYEKMGMKTISLYANLDAGGYAWARYGFQAQGNQGSQTISESIDTAQRLVRENAKSLSPAAMAEFVSWKMAAKATIGTDDELGMFTDLKTPTLDKELGSVLHGEVPQLKTPSLTKAAMQNQSWDGVLKLNDTWSRMRFDRYVGL